MRRWVSIGGIVAAAAILAFAAVGHGSSGATPTHIAACKRIPRHVIVNLDDDRHHHIIDHAFDARRAGHPRILHILREEARANRRASLRGIPTKQGFRPRRISAGHVGRGREGRQRPLHQERGKPKRRPTDGLAALPVLQWAELRLRAVKLYALVDDRLPARRPLEQLIELYEAERMRRRPWTRFCETSPRGSSGYASSSCRSSSAPGTSRTGSPLSLLAGDAVLSRSRCLVELTEPIAPLERRHRLRLALTLSLAPTPPTPAAIAC